MTKKPEIYALADSDYSKKYRLVQIQDKYYFLNCYQSYLGNILFLFNWILPLKLLEIHPADFKMLKTSTSNQVTEPRKANRVLGILLGLIIGNFIYSLTKELVIARGISYLLFFMTISVCPLLRKLMVTRHQKQVISSLKYPTDNVLKAVITPILIKRSLLVYLMIIIFMGPFLWFLTVIYFKGSQILSLLLLGGLFFVYTFQAICATNVGAYKIRQVGG